MFTGKETLGFSILCLKSQASSMLKIPFREAVKRNFPKRWYAGCPAHTHEALEDAIEQGSLGINMIREDRGLEPIVRITNACGYQGSLEPVR
jgi:hypothetical protein